MTGQIPTEIGLATNLITFNMKGNTLTTSIPSEIGNLKAMENFIILDQLRGIGSIPTEVGLMSSLKIFEMGDSGDVGFMGTLPSSFVKCTDLEEIMIVASSINGTIPVEFSQLRKMKQIKLDRNQLSGTLPGSLSALTNLELFDVGGNAITGVFPTTYEAWTSLKIAKIGGTNMSGSVPTFICDNFNGGDDFSGGWYGFYADCDEFDDGCQCCTHCCPNEASFRSCENDGPSADRYNADVLAKPGGPSGPGGPAGGPFGPPDQPPNNF